ncbi:MAG TPA: hypothetical protein VEA78_05940, partial [Acidimicrobiales bacterium]|nr:hypothetical protein [Acidimicrobiales bacterium]
MARPSALRAAVVGVGVFTALWCAVGLAVPSTFGAHVAVDEPQYLLSATSLWEDLDLDISDELADERWRAYHEARLPVQTKLLDGGRQVSPHDPLLPALLAVPMGLGGWVAAKAVLAALAGALAAVLVWTCVVRLDVPVRRAVIGVACFSLSAPLAIYATQVYPEVPGALCVALALAGVLGRSRRAMWCASVCVVLLPWLSVKYVAVAAVLALFVLWRWRSIMVVTFWVAMGALFVGVHLAVYDGITPYATGDHFVGGEHEVVGTNVNLGGRARRLLALLVDRDYGLVAWQPAWLLVLPALRRNAQSAVFLAGWLTATFVALTMHGYWWPGRQTVVVLPA